jgi:uncharacterized protein YaaR (DUF327 family)
MKMREGSLYKNQHATQRAEILSGEGKGLRYFSLFSQAKDKHKQAQLYSY